MNWTQAKNGPRLKLDAEAYRELWWKVLKRDGWRCQQCGSMENLQVHHIRWRSQLGGDTEENLMTLCEGCHRQVHQGGLAQQINRTCY